MWTLCNKVRDFERRVGKRGSALPHLISSFDPANQSAPPLCPSWQLRPGAPGHPEVQAAIDRAIRTIVASGKAAGTLTADLGLARRYLELGATFVAVGIDVTLLAQAARRLAGEFGLGTESAMSAAGASAY